MSGVKDFTKTIGVDILASNQKRRSREPISIFGPILELEDRSEDRPSQDPAKVGWGVRRRRCGFQGVSEGLTPYRLRSSGPFPFGPLNLRWNDPGRTNRSPVQDSSGTDFVRFFRRSYASARRATFELESGKHSPVFLLTVLRMAR